MGHDRAPRASRERWRVTVVDTGPTHIPADGSTARSHFVDERFLLTYGDGVADVDLDALVRFHEAHGRRRRSLRCVPPRDSVRSISTATSRELRGKPQAHGGWINGGFFVLERSVLDLIDGDEIALEREPMERLAKAGQLMAYRHQVSGNPWIRKETSIT